MEEWVTKPSNRLHAGMAHTGFDQVPLVEIDTFKGFSVAAEASVSVDETSRGANWLRETLQMRFNDKKQPN